MIACEQSANRHRVRLAVRQALRNMTRISYFSSYFWSFVNSGGSQVIGFLSTMLIARIATAEQFGLIAICSSVVLISNILSEGGLSSTVIINKEFSIEKASTVLIIVAAASISTFFIILFFKNSFASLFEQDKVAQILPIMALTIVANGLRSVHAAVLIRNLQFKKLSAINLTSVCIASGIGVAVAFVYDTLVGLVLVYVLTPVLATVALWTFAPWGFYFFCKPSLLYADLSFTINVTLSSFLDQASKAVLVLLLNNRLGVTELGFYSRADAIKNLATQTLDKVIQRASFPLLSRENHESLGNAINGHIRISVVLTSGLIPLMYIFSNYSESIIYLIYGPNWSASVPILENIVYLAFFMALTSQNVTLFKALDYAKIMTYNRCLGLVLLPAVFIFVDSKNILEIVVGLTIYAIILYCVSVFGLVFLGGDHIIRYCKYISFASVVSSVIILSHYFLIEISLDNMLFGLSVNCFSLVVTMLVVYSALFIIRRGLLNAKT